MPIVSLLGPPARSLARLAAFAIRHSLFPNLQSPIPSSQSSIGCPAFMPKGPPTISTAHSQCAHYLLPGRNLHYYPPFSSRRAQILAGRDCDPLRYLWLRPVVAPSFLGSRRGDKPAENIHTLPLRPPRLGVTLLWLRPKAALCNLRNLRHGVLERIRG